MSKSKNIDYIVWIKFKKYFGDLGFVNYKPLGLIGDSKENTFIKKAGIVEIGNIISQKAIKGRISWISLWPVFHYENLKLSHISKKDISMIDVMTCAFAMPLKKIKVGKNNIKESIGKELNYYYSLIKTKAQRKEIYKEFLNFLKEKKISVGHESILSDKFLEKYSLKYIEKYNETKIEKYLFKHIAVLDIIRMTQNFNQRFDLFKNMFDYFELIGMDKQKLYFSVHGGGHPISDFVIPEDRLTKKILVNSFDIDEKKIFKISNEKTLEIYLDKKYPQIGPRPQIFYRVDNDCKGEDCDMIEIGNMVFSEYFFDVKDKTVKYSENLISKLSFHLQKLSIALKDNFGESMEIKDISVLLGIVEKIKDEIRESRGYYSDEPFSVEKNSILKFSHYLLCLVVLLLERVDLEKNKNSDRYAIYEDVFKQVDDLFFELHIIDKERVFNFVYDVVEIVCEHYKRMYPKIYNISSKQKEKIVELISIKIINRIDSKITKYKSIINQDW